MTDCARFVNIQLSKVPHAVERNAADDSECAVGKFGAQIGRDTMFAKDHKFTLNFVLLAGFREFLSGFASCI